MLRSLKEITGYTIIDLNNDVVGQAHDFYFDDATWTIRYLIVNTGVWLPGRKVLISPVVLERPDVGGGVSLPVRLTKVQIENSPSIDLDRPVSRQQEVDLAKYYEWPTYWDDVTFFDAQAVGMNPDAYVESRREAAAAKQGQKAVVDKTIAGEQRGDPHLRSSDEVMGYYIQAEDGDIGHVEDFILEDDTWLIRYMVIDTRNWWPGKKVIISPLWVEKIDWKESQVFVDLSRETIKSAPEYDPSMPVNRDYETRLYDYYGRPKYWF